MTKVNYSCEKKNVLLKLMISFLPTVANMQHT